MDEKLWVFYLQLLESNQEPPALITCVGCWYEQHPNQVFPGDRVSSSLCLTHTRSLPPEVKRPDSLWEVAA